MIDLARPEWLALLAPVAALAAIVVRAARRRRGDVAALGMDEAVARRARRRHALGAAGVLVGLSVAVVAMARPAWGPAITTERARGADVVVAVDVSLSMLAEDVRPSRLERAKLVLADLLDRLDGDRVGLVGFAGSSGVLIPLTPDLEAAKMFAVDLEAQSVDEPGTALLRAVRRSVEMFDAAAQGGRVLVVLSDGEDQSGDPVAVAEEAAAVARDADVRVVAVTVGTEAGGTIPLDVIGTSAVKRDTSGAPVTTRANRDALRTLAADGLYLDAGQGDEPARIAQFVGESAASWERDELRRQRPERFQALLLGVVAILFGTYIGGAWRP